MVISFPPVFAEMLTFAKGHITTPHGEIAVEWKRTDNGTEVKIDLCENTVASFVHNGTETKLTAGLNTIRI